MGPFAEVWTPGDWRQYLGQPEIAGEADAIRQSTHTGRPLGAPDFIERLEKQLRRRLTPQKGGRPPKNEPDGRQQSLTFEAH